MAIIYVKAGLAEDIQALAASGRNDGGGGLVGGGVEALVKGLEGEGTATLGLGALGTGGAAARGTRCKQRVKGAVAARLGAGVAHRDVGGREGRADLDGHQHVVDDVRDHGHWPVDGLREEVRAVYSRRISWAENAMPGNGGGGGDGAVAYSAKVSEASPLSAGDWSVLRSGNDRL